MLKISIPKINDKRMSKAVSYIVWLEIKKRDKSYIKNKNNRENHDARAEVGESGEGGPPLMTDLSRVRERVSVSDNIFV